MHGPNTLLDSLDVITPNVSDAIAGPLRRQQMVAAM